MCVSVCGGGGHGQCAQRARSFRKGREGFSDVSSSVSADANVDVERLEQVSCLSRLSGAVCAYASVLVSVQLLINARQFRMARAAAADASVTSTSSAGDFARACAGPGLFPAGKGIMAMNGGREWESNPHRTDNSPHRV